MIAAVMGGVLCADELPGCEIFVEELFVDALVVGKLVGDKISSNLAQTPTSS